MISKRQYTIGPVPHIYKPTWCVPIGYYCCHGRFLGWGETPKSAYADLVRKLAEASIGLTDTND